MILQTPRMKHILQGLHGESHVNDELASNKEREVYIEVFRIFDPSSRYQATQPEEVELTGAPNICSSFSDEQRIRFRAMNEVWNRRRYQVNRSDHPAPSESAEIDTVKGHYALYQVVFSDRDFFKAVSVFPRMPKDVILNNYSRIIGSNLLALDTVQLGDVLIVKELRQQKTDKAIAQFKILKRNAPERNCRITTLKCNRAVQIGTGNLVYFPYSEIHKEVAHLEPKSFRDFALTTLADLSSPLTLNNSPPLRLAHRVVGARERSDKTFYDYRYNTYVYSRAVVNHIMILGSSLLHAAYFGVYDLNKYKVDKILPARDMLAIKVRSLNRKLWVEGVYFSIGDNCTAQVLHVDFDTRDTRILSTIYAKVTQGMGNFQPGYTTIHQVGVFEYPILKSGWYEELDSISNGRQVIIALFKGFKGLDDEPKVVLPIEDIQVLSGSKLDSKSNDLKEEQLKEHDTRAESSSNATSANEFELDEPQRVYVKRLLDEHDVTIGCFPISSGKSSTIAIAAYKLASQEPESLNLVLVPNTQSSEVMADIFIKLGLNSDSHVKVLRLGWQNQKSSPLNFDLREVLKKIVSGEYLVQDPATLQKARETLRSSSVQQSEVLYWLGVYFTIAAPQIVILDGFTFWHVLKVLKNVKTIQFDDADRIPQVEFMQILSNFQDCIYGVMGDPSKRPPVFPTFKKDHEVVVTGQLMKDAEKCGVFPIVKSRNIYNVHPVLLNVLSSLFNLTPSMAEEELANKYKMESRKVPVHIVRTWATTPQRAWQVANIVDQLISSGNAPEDIGILCFAFGQVGELEKLNPPIHPSVTVGVQDHFRGVQKKNMILWTNFMNIQYCDEDIIHMMTRGSHHTTLLEYTAGSFLRLFQALKRHGAIVTDLESDE